jgi:xylose isomerase
MILWPGIEGYNYPFQTPYREAWARFMDGVGEVATRCQERGITLFLEHKNSEPAMKILMRNVGMTLHVIHTLRARGITSVKVNMDWQHLLMNGESLAEYAALLAAEGLLGHQHANSDWGYLRRRQHGQRDRVHGDARARDRAASARAMG